MKIEKKSYERIIELNSQLVKLQEKINSLKPIAIKELYKMGYSMDSITLMLRVGKVNVVKILNNKKKTIGKTGRKRKWQLKKK